MLSLLFLIVMSLLGLLAIGLVIGWLLQNPVRLLGVVLVYLFFWVVLPWMDHPHGRFRKDPEAAPTSARQSVKHKTPKSDAQRTADEFNQFND